MAKTTTPQATATASSGTPSVGSLASLVVLGVVSALWALFLWAQLVVSRAGGGAFCPLAGGDDCATAWGSAFASAVHRQSGVPVAGWGLVWGLMAFALPLLALLRRAEGRAAPGPEVAAVRIAAAVGAASIVVLLGVSLIEGAFCTGCFLTYALVAGYAGIALAGWQRVGLPEAGKGLALSVALALASYLLLLYPGLATPRDAAEAARQAVAGSIPGTVSGQPSSGTGDPARDQHLAEFVASLTPQLKQTLSDSLYIYRNAETALLPPSRRLIGSPEAPVRITEWTDIICDHCAGLHGMITTLRKTFPEGSFSVDPREFPLDGACNPLLRPRDQESVRCIASKARLCLEEHPQAWELSKRLFEIQKSLTPAKVFETASSYGDRAQIEACVADPATQSRLEEDVRLAAGFHPDGTPIVAINGRRGTSFGPFLYAMILTRGVDNHPVFADLPPPNPEAHLH